MHREPMIRMNLARMPHALLLAGLLLPACGDASPSESQPVAETRTVEPAAATAGTPQPAAEAATPAGSPGAPAPATESPAPAAPVKVVSSFDSEVNSGVKPAGLELPADDPVLGPVLVINGEVIPHERVRRRIIFGDPGRVALEMKKLEVIMNQEIARRVEQGASMEEFLVSREEVDADIAEQEEALREEFPDEDVELRHVLPIGADGLPDRVMVTKMFTKVFLPDVAPSEYPPTTLAALHSNEQGEVLLQSLEQEWEAKQNGEEVESNPLFAQMIYQTLREHLLATSNIEEGEHVPDGVLMRINGEDVMLDEIWAQVKPHVSISDVRSAKQWIVNLTLLEQELGAAWLSEAAAAEDYAAHSDPYKDSMFSVETIALMIKKYPNLMAYKQFRRAYDSFQDRISEELSPDALKSFAEQRTLMLVGQAKVDVDVILCSAFDFREKKWKEDGWAQAEERAKEVLRQLIEEKRPWNDVQEEFSDFYDPPLPQSYVGEAQGKAKGRFRAVTRNQLMQYLEESEYWQFLNGKTVTDFIFFEQEPGSVAKPMRGPHGWYIPRLRTRTPAPENVNLTEENLIIMAEQDYTLQRLSEFVQEIIASNEVYGLQ